MEQDTFTDVRDGRIYKTAKIGEQVWMVENLDYTVDNVVGIYYNNDPKYKECGRLYDWVEAMCVAPKGWHLPTKEEWQELIDYCGGKHLAGKKLKSKESWKNKGNGTDEFGFNALPSGYGNSSGDFSYAGKYGHWWSASEYNAKNAYFLDMCFKDNYFVYDYKDRAYLFSVRCIKN